MYYDMIFKRKSFHIFTGKKHLTNKELNDIKIEFNLLKPLISDIKIDIKIVPRIDTSCKRGEYCILLYSEKKDNYLQNIGYIGEQLDLWLTSKNIGACWYGMGKTNESKYNGLDFVIMIAIEKVDEQEFRKDMYSAKRKELSEIWSGNDYNDIANIVRFAPSACNTQPWYVEGINNKLTIYRYKKPGKRGLMPIDSVTYYNRIDIGIFILFMEICLAKNDITFTRQLLLDEGKDIELTKTAIYTLFNYKVTNNILNNKENIEFDTNVLISNMDKIHTTKLGEERIKRNLNIDTDVVVYCKQLVNDKNSIITKEGKNWYVRNNNILVTINSYNYSIITAHKKRIR